MRIHSSFQCFIKFRWVKADKANRFDQCIGFGVGKRIRESVLFKCSFLLGETILKMLEQFDVHLNDVSFK